MGAWGMGPLENDAALDWLSVTQSDILNKIKKTIAKKGRRFDEDECRAAAELFIKSFDANIIRNIDAEILASDLIATLHKIKNDDQWVDTWDSPSEIRASVNKQIRKLRRIEKEIDARENEARSFD